jgi:hypothetical protein
MSDLSSRSIRGYRLDLASVSVSVSAINGRHTMCFVDDDNLICEIDIKRFSGILL